MTQCHESSQRIAEHLDNLFGLDKYYQNAHLQIQSCFVIGNSGINPPRIDSKTGHPVPGFNSHLNQYGGLEGMR